MGKIVKYLAEALNANAFDEILRFMKRNNIALYNLGREYDNIDLNASKNAFSRIDSSEIEDILRNDRRCHVWILRDDKIYIEIGDDPDDEEFYTTTVIKGDMKDNKVQKLAKAGEFNDNQYTVYSIDMSKCKIKARKKYFAYDMTRDAVRKKEARTELYDKLVFLKEFSKAIHPILDVNPDDKADVAKFIRTFCITMHSLFTKRAITVSKFSLDDIKLREFEYDSPNKLFIDVHCPYKCERENEMRAVRYASMLSKSRAFPRNTEFPHRDIFIATVTHMLFQWPQTFSAVFVDNKQAISWSNFAHNKSFTTSQLTQYAPFLKRWAQIIV